jgi:hypothetical protein
MGRRSRRLEQRGSRRGGGRSERGTHWSGKLGAALLAVAVVAMLLMATCQGMG